MLIMTNSKMQFKNCNSQQQQSFRTSCIKVLLIDMRDKSRDTLCLFSKSFNLHHFKIFSKFMYRLHAISLKICVRENNFN